MSGLCPKCLARYSFLDLEGDAAADQPPEEPDETIKVNPEVDLEIERRGMIIGRYKLLEQIGEGGFGLVYMAEQVEPVQRKVALKVIKAGMDTKAVVARWLYLAADQGHLEARALLEELKLFLDATTLT